MPVLDGQDMPTCEGLLCLPCLALLLLTGIAREVMCPFCMQACLHVAWNEQESPHLNLCAGISAETFGT